ncbi:hypothetical protein HanRHA438_Chr17g0805841 [Helianthus annuus]|nr:hypothetical protein HanRHA438_Chr17g0805841 [Helianthus annuus]
MVVQFTPDPRRRWWRYLRRKNARSTGCLVSVVTKIQFPAKHVQFPGVNDGYAPQQQQQPLGAGTCSSRNHVIRRFHRQTPSTGLFREKGG